MPMRRRQVAGLVVAAIAAMPLAAAGTIAGPGEVRPNRAGQMLRPLRYEPDRGGFRIENGAERFNRPLYGGNTAFRVDGGDTPEFVLYLPGRGGNLRFAVKAGAAVWWLHDAAHIVTRYVPGELDYEIRDPRLGAGALRLRVIAGFETEGVLVRAEGDRVGRDVRLLWAYGGVNGERGRRDGDIGTESVPISAWFQPRPGFAEGNHIAVEGAQGFTLTAAAGRIAGAVSGGRITGLASADMWDDPARLFGAVAASPARPLVLGELDPGVPSFLSIQILGHGKNGLQELADYRAVRRDDDGPPAAPTLLPAFAAADLPRRFDAAATEAARRRSSLRVETPDPYLDAAVAALNIGADATWDETQHAIMHGAIAWRAKLLGWRGPYALDALGWHDRADANIRGWIPRQNDAPVPPAIPPADESAHLARSETALHSNGDLSRSHYDMNSVFIDALFRHLAWTGDLTLAREVWPVITRHLAWQRRLFRRTFDASGLPLYESYAQIWASDDIFYNGGGTAYGSAYNVYANRQAARLAMLLGKDGAPFAAEADAIEAGMRRYLWQPEPGMFAEYKDLLGRQSVHPGAGLWSYYHVIDSEVPTPEEAWSMTGALLHTLPRLPVVGPGVPADDGYALFPTTDWMPYNWSVNNVVMGENAHAALALWQAGRAGDAYRLAKSAILASMYMGITPGNVGTLNYLDVFRRESQRDFADGAGVLSRAVVEGLFGIRPDALAGHMLIQPGLPAGWDHAALHHADIDLSYRRQGRRESWTIDRLAAPFRTVTLRLPARYDRLRAVTINGRPVAWRADRASVGHPMLLIDTPAAARIDLTLDWAGTPIAIRDGQGALVPHRQGAFSWSAPEGKAAAVPAEFALAPDVQPAGVQEPIDLAPVFNGRLPRIFAPGKYRTPRSPGVSLALPDQGIGAWAGHLDEMARIDDSGLRAVAAGAGGALVLPDGGRLAIRGDADGARAAFVSQWSNYPREATVPLTGRARYLRLLMAGSTNPMQSRIGNGEVVVAYADGGQVRLPLHNPTSWWPIEKDYLIDDYQFHVAGSRPLRVDLKTGRVRMPDGLSDAAIDGGAATILGIALDPHRELRSLTVRALAQDVVIGTIGATLTR